MATDLVEAPPMPELPLHRLSFETFEKLVEFAILTKRDPVVLLDGLLVTRRKKDAPYCHAVNQGAATLRTVVPIGWHLQQFPALVLRDGLYGDSVPEPCLAIVFGGYDRYSDRLPNGDETGLVLEVATSPDALREKRSGLFRYAHAGIPIVGIVNTRDRSIEVFREPSGPVAAPRYQMSEILRPSRCLSGEIGTATTGPAVLAPVLVGAFFPNA